MIISEMHVQNNQRNKILVENGLTMDKKKNFLYDCPDGWTKGRLKRK